jgi:hypothetical protein
MRRGLEKRERKKERLDDVQNKQGVKSVHQ